MQESELINLIRQVVKEELAPIMLSIMQSNESVLRSTVQRTPSEAPIASLRNVQPYGLASRAPQGKQMLTTPVAFDPTHITMNGCFDLTKPEMEDGESILYNEYGQLIYMKNGSIHLATKTSGQNLVLGQVFKEMMSTLLQALADHTHIGNLGYNTSPPDNMTVYTDLKESPIDDEVVLSQIVFTE